MDNAPEAFIFMKVGNHAHESWEDILERKRIEYESTGMIFWGYGGTTCHPLRQVQPFARTHLENHGKIYILMEPINSNADPELHPAQEYSRDGIIWEPIPEGISVLGSRYALVLDEITSEQLDVHLEGYSVAVGNSMGRSASEYVRGRVDKGCFEICPSRCVVDEGNEPRRIQYAAEVIEPFAVMLR